jgi:sugar phosphate isomerase/epimerase
MIPAFSTVACPHWTLTRVAAEARAWGFPGVEFRTFGQGSASLACDPALSDPAKVRAMFDRAGVRIAGLGTSVRLDEPITPPVIGHLFDPDLAVREAHAAIDLAVELEAPYVRVFAFEAAGDEPRKRAVARIVGRLARVADHCRNSGVRVVIENGGSFPTAVDLAEFIDRVDNPLVGASYSLPVARRAGENPLDGLNVLGEWAVVCRVKDASHGVPCALGRGDLRAREDLAAVAASGFSGWVVYEHYRLWIAGSPEPGEVMPESARVMFESMPRAERARPVPR